MAKYQRKEEDSSQQLDDETELEKIIPTPALPTLSTLTDFQSDAPEVDLSRLTPAASEDGEAGKEDEVASMGPGLSASEEASIANFLASVAEEFQVIEWPSAARVVRFTLIVLASLSLAVAALYFVDGFFYRMSVVIFGDKV